MDILDLVDRLEELVQEGRSLPLIRGVLVDEERLWEIIDQMRISVPEEVRKAQQLLSQKDRIVAQAQERARRIVQQAESERAKMIEESAIVQSAKERAEEIVAQAQEEAGRIRAEAEAYVLNLFRKAEQQLQDALQKIQTGIRVLHETSNTVTLSNDESEM